MASTKTKAITKIEKPTERKRTDKNEQKSLHRSNTNKVLAGVAGGIGEYFNIDPTIIRLVFILLTVFGGSGVLIYLILWIIMPSSQQLKSATDNVVKQNIDEMTEKAKSFAHDLNFRNTDNQNDSRFWWGLLIIIFGILLLFQNLGIFDIINLHQYWPIFLILVGIIILLKKK